MRNIHITTWTFSHKTKYGKSEMITIPEILVTGDVQDDVINDEFYIKRALRRKIDKITPDVLLKYIPVKVEFLLRVGQTSF